MFAQHRVYRSLFHLLLVFIALFLVSMTINTPMMHVLSATKTPTAPARINIADVLENVRANSSVRINLFLKQEENNLANSFEATSFYDVSAFMVSEEIMTLDEEPSSLTEPNYLIGVIHGTTNEYWLGNAPDDLSRDDDETTISGRLFGTLIILAFRQIPEGNFAKLSKADQEVDDVPCDEYTWTYEGNPATMCITRNSQLPVHLSFIWQGNIEVEVNYFDYAKPSNVFELPHEEEGVYITDAFMALNKLSSFEYKVTYSGVKGKAKPVVDAVVQGVYDQATSAFQAKYWAKTEGTSKPPTKRFLQMGRLRWQAGGNEKQAYAKMKPLDTRAAIDFLDPITRSDPFLAWISMSGENDLNIPGELVSDDKMFNGQPAIEYRYEVSKDNFITLLILEDENIPVYAEQHITDNRNRQVDIITWELLQMDQSDVEITKP